LKMYYTIMGYLMIIGLWLGFIGPYCISS